MKTLHNPSKFADERRLPSNPHLHSSEPKKRR